MGSHAQVGLALGTAAGAWVNLTLLIWFAARANLITIEPALWKSMARIAFAGLCSRSRSLLSQRPVGAAFAGWRFSQEATLFALGLIGVIVYGIAAFTPIGWRVLVVRR